MKQYNTSFHKLFFISTLLLTLSISQAHSSEIDTTLPLLSAIEMEFASGTEFLPSNGVAVTPSEVIISLPFEEQTIVIYDITGRVWYKGFSSGEKQIYISRSSLPSGLVLIEIVSKEKQRRVIKVKL